MRYARSANVVIGTAFAALFGLMSLFHGTVMAFAKPAHGPAHHVMTGEGNSGGHHGHARTHSSDNDEQSTHTIPDAVSFCYGVGCFIVLGSFAGPLPSASTIPFARLSPSRVKAMISAIIDPAVPPPRIQV